MAVSSSGLGRGPLTAETRVRMESHGVKKLEEDDPLIIRAVDLYCKCYFYLENKDSERYLESYKSLRDHLSLAGDYNHE